MLGTTNSTAVWPSTCKRFILAEPTLALTKVPKVAFYHDVLTARVCNDRPLPCNTAGECVSEEDAAKIFELINLESE